MSRTIVTGDLHQSENQRDAYRFAFIGWLIELIEKSGNRPNEKSFPVVQGVNSISTVVVLGDLTEEKDRHSAELVNRMVDLFRKLASYVHVVILKGNHDYTSNADNPFFRFLGHLPNITWINAPIKFTDPDLGQVMFLPHTRDYKTDWADLDFKACDLIFAHNTFAGANVGPRTMDGIPTDIFKGTPVISGDIHVPQTFDNVTYVGAPYTCDFGDDYDPRVLVLDAKSTKSVPVDGVQKRLVELPDAKASLADALKKAHVNKGDIVKVRIKTTGDDRGDWTTVQKGVRDWCDANGFVCNTVQPIGGTNAISKRNLEAPSGRTDDQILVDYGKRFGVSKETLDIGLGLMRLK